MDLGEQKLIYSIKGKFLFTKTRENIYWNEIKSLTYDSLPSAGVSIIRVKLKDGSKLGLSIINVAGNDESTFNQVLEYFKRYK